jgi:hypothetical protein
MTGNSLDSLLAWLKESPGLLGWDLIVALEGRKINLNLQQDYIIRLSQGSDLGSFEGVLPIPETGLTQYLTGFRMGAPVLSFEKATLANARIKLSVPVVAGTQMFVGSLNGQNQVLKLRTLDPMDGADIRMDLTIDADSRKAHVDLAQGENIVLSLLQEPAQQLVAEKLLKAWLEGKDDAKRVYSLGTFADEGNPFMLPRSIDVRVHRNPQAQTPQATDEDAAVLLFTAMTDGCAGDFPGGGTDFRYLIPDPDSQRSYSGTALFSQALLPRAAFGNAVLQLLDNAQFQRVTDGTGRLTKMVAQSGTLEVAQGYYESLEYEFESQPFSLEAAGGAVPLTVEFDDHQATQRWHGRFPLTFDMRPLKGNKWESHTATFTIKLEHEFHLMPDESGESTMVGELFVPYGNTHGVEHISGLPGTIKPEVLQQIYDFVAFTVKRAILERFSNTLTTTSSEDCLQGFDILGNSTLQPSVVEKLPLDLAMFGQIHSSGSSFTIKKPQPFMAAGTTQQMSTEPARTGLRWSVENLAESISDPGSIDAETGLYKAPPAHAINGTFNQILVVARDGNETSVALISVQSNPITVNPQIQVCNYNERVELSAVHVSGERLTWAIKNPVPGESGRVVESTEAEGDHTYIAGPRVDSKTWVLDEVEVSDTSGKTGSAYVLVNQKTSLVVISPVKGVPLPEGKIQLQATFDGVPIDARWSIELGPGVIDESGLYEDDPTGKMKFVIVRASVEDTGRTFDGYQILPLPLSDFPAVIKALAE